jgi:hypothetical protein
VPGVEVDSADIGTAPVSPPQPSAAVEFVHRAKTELRGAIFDRVMIDPAERTLRVLVSHGVEPAPPPEGAKTDPRALPKPKAWRGGCAEMAVPGGVGALETGS